MGFCKENENKLCKPFECRTICPIGEKLRNLRELSRCGRKKCPWINAGIDGVNSCKDRSCSIGNIIVEFRKKETPQRN